MFYTSSGTGQFTEGNDPFWTLAGYVVDDNKSSYPDGGTKDAYWYEMISDGIPFDILDCTKYAIDEFTPTALVSANSLSIAHSLGDVPRIVRLIPKSTVSGQYYGSIADFYGSRLDDYMNSVYGYCNVIKNSGKSSNSLIASVTEESVKFNSYYFEPITYALITVG